MQYFIVNVDFPQPRIHSIPQLLLHHLLPISFQERISELADPCGFYELWQFEHRLENTSLALKELRLLVPMPRHRNCILQRFQIYQKQRVRCRNIPRFHQIRSLHHLLQLRNPQPPHHLHLLPGNLLLLHLLILLLLLLHLLGLHLFLNPIVPLRFLLSLLKHPFQLIIVPTRQDILVSVVHLHHSVRLLFLLLVQLAYLLFN